MANKIILARGTKARIETIKETLLNYELVYSIDTKELGVKNNDGTIEYIGKPTELEWANILNKPAFKPVATTGDYNDLTNKPDLTLKLDKNFTALPSQASPLLTDVLVTNRGTAAQKVTLGNLLAQVDNEIFVVVATLPTTGVVNKIYLLPKGTPESQDGFDEFIWANNAWELIGSVKLDLSNYYEKKLGVEIDDERISLSDESGNNNTLTPKGFTIIDELWNMLEFRSNKITYTGEGLAQLIGFDLSEEIPVITSEEVNSSINPGKYLVNITGIGDIGVMNNIAGFADNGGYIMFVTDNEDLPLWQGDRFKGVTQIFVGMTNHLTPKDEWSDVNSPVKFSYRYKQKETGAWTKPETIVNQTTLDSVRTSVLNSISNAINTRVSIAQQLPATPEMTERVGINDNNELVVKPSSGGGIPEAPIDDKLYGRKNGSWSEVISGGGGATIEKIDANVYLSKPDLNINDILSVVYAIHNDYDFWQVRGVGKDTKDNEINYYADSNGSLDYIQTVNYDIENYGSFINVHDFDESQPSIDYAVTTIDLTDYGLQIGTFDVKTQKGSSAFLGFYGILGEINDIIEFILTQVVLESNFSGYVSNPATPSLALQEIINSAIEINNAMLSLSKVNYFTDGLEDYMTNEMILYDIRLNDALFVADKAMPGLPTYILNFHSRIYFDTTDNEVKNMLKWELEEFTKP